MGPLGFFNPSDQIFFKAFHERTLDQFAHRDHLKLVWIILERHGLEKGMDVIRQGIKDFAEYQGAAGRYHETLTTFWARLTHHAIQSQPSITDFETFLASFPFLLDKDLPLKHWTKESLWSPAARKAWVEPDLRPIP